MSEFKLTPAQATAVEHRGSSLLVSAAAGSGKTRVLTQRLMSYVCDQEHKLDINRFLIITYTRAAAAELRGRILEELASRSAADPANRRLRRQNSLCYCAPIGTIHSFCTSILREYCHKISLSPDFRVGDEDKCAELRDKALDKLLDRAYENMDRLAGFAQLADSVGAGRSDARLEAAILDLHGKIRSHPYPELWVQEQLELACPPQGLDVSATIWGSEIMENARVTAKYWCARLDGLWFSMNSSEDENAPLLQAYGSSLLETMEALRNLLRSFDLGWEGLRAALPIPFPRLSPLKDYPYDDRKIALTTARDGCKKAMASLLAQFDQPSEVLMAELRASAPANQALLELALEFDRLYAVEKHRHKLLDFSDLEHCALELLRDPQTGAPTEAAVEISHRFTEIMVDEYQDVNAVQEAIFRAVSQEEKNIFMVGDVKQSIYRFRLADPTIFLEKYHRFAEPSDASPGEAVKILLQTNFRSDRQILAACNHVFRNIFSESLGELDYDDASALFPPENAPPPRGLVKLSVLATQTDLEDEDRPDKTTLEADFIAEQIAGLVASGETILDRGVPRPIGYSDIAILMRSPGPVGAQYLRALSRRGIPALSQQDSGFFTAPEIVVMRAFLGIIDNPHRDIPLTAVLASPIFGFTADELSQIRTAQTNCDFFTALSEFSLRDEKSADFLKSLNQLRELSAHIGVRALLSHIYGAWCLPALWTAKQGGQSGSTNLMLLLELADSFESGGYRGLFSFLKQLNRMEQRRDEPRSLSSSSAGGVSIMSIHKSKGLEFPVVFLANTSRKFNAKDLQVPVLVHPALGIGGKITDLARGIEYPCISRRAISARLMREMLSEEMRVLYVAMTRARERLYISCTAKEPEALFEKLSRNLSSPLDFQILGAAPSMSHWLISAALLDAGQLIQLEAPAYTPAPLDLRPEVREAPCPLVAPEELQALERRLTYRYPFEAAQGLPSKLTATLLPETEHDLDAQPLIAPRKRIFRLPKLDGGSRPLSGAERGTATHIVMQLIDFGLTDTLDHIEGEIARITDLGQLDLKQAKAVDRNAILHFFASDLGGRIRRAQKVYREFRFSLLCPAEEFFPQGGQEQLLLQGVVDCCIEENGRLTIIDYKTDRVSLENLDELTVRYEKQLRAYAYAMERITEKPVENCLLCFLGSDLVAQLRP